MAVANAFWIQLLDDERKTIWQNWLLLLLLCDKSFVGRALGFHALGGQKNRLLALLFWHVLPLIRLILKLLLLSIVLIVFGCFLSVSC